MTCTSWWDAINLHISPTKGWGDMVVRGGRGGGREEWWGGGGAGQELGKVKVSQTFQLSEPLPHQWDSQRHWSRSIMEKRSYVCQVGLKGSKVVPHCTRLYTVLSSVYHHCCWIISKTLYLPLQSLPCLWWWKSFYFISSPLVASSD